MHEFLILGCGGGNPLRLVHAVPGAKYVFTWHIQGTQLMFGERMDQVWTLNLVVLLLGPPAEGSPAFLEACFKL